MRAYGTITRDRDGRWVIDAEPHIALRLKRVMGKVSKAAMGPIRLSSTPETCRDLAWFIDRYPLEIAPLLKKALQHGAKQHVETIQRLEQLVDINYTPHVFTLALPARSYQAREAEIYLSKGSLLIADDVGLGKTAAGICSLTDPRALPCAVVTLTHLPDQWAAEVRKFAPDLLVHVIRRGTPYPLPQFMGRGPDVVILSYSKLAGWGDTLRHYVQSAIFDEIQELRHEGSQKYNAAVALTEGLPFRLGMSATPIYNYGGEIYNVLNVLSPGALGSADEFYTEWCTGNDEKAKIKDPRAFGAYLRENFLMIRHTRKQVGRELPPVQKVVHRIASDTAALDKIENAAMELARIIVQKGPSIKGQKFEASEQFTTMMRQATGLAKAPYVADFVRLLVECGEKVVLAGWHRAVYDIWLAKLAEFKPVMYTGSETIPQKAASVDAFVNGDARVFMMSLRSGAGLNGLQEAASIVVFGEIDWSPGVHEQFIGRLNRDGQTTPVMAYFLLADEGSDPIVAEICGIKSEQVEGIRNPDHDLLERLDTSGGESAVKRLAEAYLERRHGIKKVASV